MQFPTYMSRDLNVIEEVSEVQDSMVDGKGIIRKSNPQFQNSVQMTEDEL